MGAEGPSRISSTAYQAGSVSEPAAWAVPAGFG